MNPSRLDPWRRKKINLNFYFHTSLRCLKRFYDGLKGTTNARGGKCWHEMKSFRRNEKQWLLEMKIFVFWERETVISEIHTGLGKYSLGQKFAKKFISLPSLKRTLMLSLIFAKHRVNKVIRFTIQFLPLVVWCQEKKVLWVDLHTMNCCLTLAIRFKETKSEPAKRFGWRGQNSSILHNIIFFNSTSCFHHVFVFCYSTYDEIKYM